MGEPSTQPEPRRFRDIHPDDVVSAMMLLFHVLLLALFLGQIAHGRIGGPDVERFRTIALHAGTPWRDFPVEYAPLQALIVRLVFGASLHTDATILAMIAWAADLATFSVLRIAWGRRAGLLYLLLGLPLLGFIYQRIDLVPVALAVTGLGLARRGREGAGGVSIAAGVLFKLWAGSSAPGVHYRSAQASAEVGARYSRCREPLVGVRRRAACARAGELVPGSLRVAGRKCHREYRVPRDRRARAARVRGGSGRQDPMVGATGARDPHGRRPHHDLVPGCPQRRRHRGSAVARGRLCRALALPDILDSIRNLDPPLGGDRRCRAAKDIGTWHPCSASPFSQAHSTPCGTPRPRQVWS